MATMQHWPVTLAWTYFSCSTHSSAPQPKNDGSGKITFFSPPTGSTNSVLVWIDFVIGEVASPGRIRSKGIWKSTAPFFCVRTVSSVIRSVAVVFCVYMHSNEEGGKLLEIVMIKNEVKKKRRRKKGGRAQRTTNMLLIQWSLRDVIYRRDWEVKGQDLRIPTCNFCSCFCCSFALGDCIVKLCLHLFQGLDTRLHRAAVVKGERHRSRTRCQRNLQRERSQGRREGPCFMSHMDREKKNKKKRKDLV